jgi:hypothetical protein
MITRSSEKGVILSLRPYTNLKFVLEAENGQELLDLLAATPDEDKPEVILMDLGCLKKTVSKPLNLLPNNTPAFIYRTYDVRRRALCESYDGNWR